MSMSIAPLACCDDVLSRVFTIVLLRDEVFCRAAEVPRQALREPMHTDENSRILFPHRLAAVKAQTVLRDKCSMPKFLKFVGQ